jgi:hypothetical protein
MSNVIEAIFHGGEKPSGFVCPRCNHQHFQKADLISCGGCGLNLEILSKSMSQVTPASQYEGKFRETPAEEIERINGEIQHLELKNAQVRNGFDGEIDRLRKKKAEILLRLSMTANGSTTDPVERALEAQRQNSPLQEESHLKKVIFNPGMDVLKKNAEILKKAEKSELEKLNQEERETSNGFRKMAIINERNRILMELSKQVKSGELRKVVCDGQDITSLLKKLS